MKNHHGVAGHAFNRDGEVPMVAPIAVPKRFVRSLMPVLVLGVLLNQPLAVARAQAAKDLPTIVVLATGGTIAGAAANDVQAGDTSGQGGGGQLPPGGAPSKK